MQRDGTSDNVEPTDGIAAPFATATDIEVLIDRDIVESYQAKWPDWRSKMAEVLRRAAAKL